MVTKKDINTLDTRVLPDEDTYFEVLTCDIKEYVQYFDMQYYKEFLEIKDTSIILDKEDMIKCGGNEENWAAFLAA